MEGQKNLTPVRRRTNKTRTAIIIIVLFHLVGLIGFLVPSVRPIFLKIVPFHLLLMTIVIAYTHQPLNAAFFKFLLVVFVSCFMVEWTGVHTGWLFGNYNYGATLGLKVDGVPLVIGLNWFLLVYSMGVMMQRSNLKNAMVRLAGGALLLVIFDLIIEPVAVQFNYWRWAGNHVPVKNYVCWFILSVALLYVFEQFNFKKQNIAGPALLITQFLFFAVLYIGVMINMLG